MLPDSYVSTKKRTQDTKASSENYMWLDVAENQDEIGVKAVVRDQVEGMVSRDQSQGLLSYA